MKIKYYLRGLGTGILFATIILSISFAVRNSDKKTVDNEATTSESRVQVETEESSEETTEQESTTQAESVENNNNITLSIKSGMSSEVVADLLADQGAISNSQEFDSYLKENGYSKTIVVGDYTIVPGMTFKEIAEIITNTN